MSEHDFLAPAGLRTRGTVIVVPGRGETSRRTPGSGPDWPPTRTGSACSLAPDLDAGEVLAG